MNKKCQVFTPKNIVIKMLDLVGYTTNLRGRRVIENACGDGNILLEIVRRYIQDCLSHNISFIDIKNGLENDIYGAEIDNQHHSKCIENLNSLAASFNIYNVQWNVLNIDILKEDIDVKFDYIVGNPPYITYRDLDQETRLFIRSKFRSCYQGKFDYCYAFIESSINCLNDNGKIAYLIPSNIFKNVFAYNLRSIMLPFVTRIDDYTTIKLFDKKLTSSSIVVLEKGSQVRGIDYYDVVRKTALLIDKDFLDKKWMFSISENQTLKVIKFGDLFKASITIATLLNEAFIIKDYKDEDNYIITNGFKIEKELLRVAVSPRSKKYKKQELIIFPYSFHNGRLTRYQPEDFEKRFPEAVKYMQHYYEKLCKRNSDQNSYWFEYGRSQALSHLNKEKLLTSTIVTNRVKVYNLTEDEIPYSGIYITSIKGLPLSKAKSILESESFLQYVKSIGIQANGESIRITAADINNYEIPEQEVE